MPPFSGVFAAAVTPHRKEGHEADFGAMLELVDFLARGGVDGICLFGSTGEFLHFQPSERIRLVHLAVKRSRVPVLAGVSHSTLDGALELGSEAMASGAAAVLLAPPYYFRYGQPEIAAFYREFAREMGKNACILLYNIPVFTNPIAFETARDLLATGLFAGIKDSSGDKDYFARLQELRTRNPFTLFVGSDRLFASARSSGADGVVSGVASALPELLVALDRALAARDEARAGPANAALQQFIDWIEPLPAPLGVKAATELRGMKVGPSAVPLSSESERHLERFREWFGNWYASVATSLGLPESGKK